MRALVTGATGLIGSQLVRSLAAKGWEVRAFVRPSSSLVHLRDLELERAVGDLLEPSSLRGALRGVDIVYHLAGETGSARPAGESSYQVNVEGTANILEASKEVGLRRFVHVSSAVTLGPTTPESPRRETDPPHVGPTSPYVESKRRSEALALTAAAEGLPVVVVSPSLVLGLGPARRPLRGPIAEALQGRPRWIVPGGTNVVDVADLVFCLEAAPERGEVGGRYVVGGENLSWMELYRRIDSLTGARPQRWPLPEGLLRLAAWAGCHWPQLVPTPHSLHWRDILEGRTFWYVDASLARETFGWKPRPLEVTLEEVVSGYLRGGKAAP